MDTIFAYQLYFIIAAASLLALSFIIFIIYYTVNMYYIQRPAIVLDMNERLLDVNI
jgi:hypothetical protein